MASLNKTSSKTRTYTWVALVLAVFTAGIFGFLLLKVNQLEADYGELRSNRVMIEKRIESEQTRYVKLVRDHQALLDEQKGLDDDVAVSRARSEQLDGLNKEVEATASRLVAMKLEAHEVQTLISMKDTAAKELLASDEELKARKEDLSGLERDIRRLNENKTVAEDQARVAESRRQTLDDQILSLSREKAGLENDIAGLDQKKNELSELEKKLTEARGLVSEAEGEGQTAERRATTATKNLKNLLVREEQFRKSLQKIRADQGAETTKLSALLEEVKTLEDRKDELAKLKSEIGGVSTELARIQSELGQAKLELDTALKKKIDLNAEIMTSRASLESIRSSLLQSTAAADAAQIRRKELENESSKLSALMGDIQAKKQIKEELDAELLMLNSNLTALRAKLDRTSVEHKTAIVELARRREMISNLTFVEGDIEAKRKIKEELDVDLGKLNSDLTKLRADLDRIRNEHVTVIAELARRREISSGMTIVEGDIQAKKQIKEELNAELGKLNSDLTKLRADLDRTRIEHETAIAELARVQAISSNLKFVEADIVIKTPQRDELVRQIATGRANMSSAIEELAVMQNEIRTAESILERRKQEISALSNISSPRAVETVGGPPPSQYSGQEPPNDGAN